jgi:hypothetical protein
MSEKKFESQSSGSINDLNKKIKSLKEIKKSCRRLGQLLNKAERIKNENK